MIGAQGFTAERMLLAALLQGKFDPTHVFSEICANSFSDYLHRRLYARMTYLFEKGLPLNVGLIADGMKLDEVETAQLGQLMSADLLVHTEREFIELARNVRRDRMLHQLRIKCEDFSKLNGSADGAFLGLLDNVELYRQALSGELWQQGLGDKLGRHSLKDLFAVQETRINWLAWPILSPGLAVIIDAPPKTGKTRLILEAIRAAQCERHFLSMPTKQVRCIYVSEQTEESFSVQVREVGFDADLSVENFSYYCREHWSRYSFVDFLRKLESDVLKDGGYNTLIFDTWHSIARLEDENDASEVADIGGRTLDVAARNSLALLLGRHDRKSGGDICQSGRSSIQLSGLMDVICHLTRTGNHPAQRKFELIGRVPGLPAVQTIELRNGEYFNLGSDADCEANEARALETLLAAEPTVNYRTIEKRTGINKSRIRQAAEDTGWSQDDDGRWKKLKPS